MYVYFESMVRIEIFISQTVTSIEYRPMVAIGSVASEPDIIISSDIRSSVFKEKTPLQIDVTTKKSKLFKFPRNRNYYCTFGDRQ